MTDPERVDLTPDAALKMQALEQPIIIESPIQGDSRKLSPPASPDAVPVAVSHIGRADPELHRNAPDAAEISDAPAELRAPLDRRALSLDALRGLFLVLMTLGFTVTTELLPAWMYHRQYPHSEAVFVNIAGLTWRDLAYGSFLFTMAAALPLTLSRRMQKGERDVGIFIAILRRGFMLVVFALLIAYSNPFFTGYTQEARLLSVIGFAIMAMIFTRRRSDWSEKKFRAMNLVGWVAALLFLGLSPFLYNKSVSLERFDGIIVGLAFAAVTGSIIWYLTRENLMARLGVLAVAVALYLGAKGSGWVADIWWAGSEPQSIFSLNKLVLLTVAIPGTIAGDLLLRWMKSSPESDGALVYWTNARIGGLAFVCVAMVPLAVIGLYNRWVVETAEILLAMIAGGFVLVWNPRTEGERLVNGLFIWSALWLMIGMILEPFEEGIHKVPDTLAYFFTVTGLAGMLLTAFAGVVDLMQRRRFVNALIDVGHNPLLCYVLFTVFLNSILQLVPVTRGLMESTPALSFTRSLLTTILVVLIVRWTSKKRIFWRT